MSLRLKNLRHPWLWYAAGAEALVVAGAVMLMARPASAPTPQVIVAQQHEPIHDQTLSHASLGHTAADK